MLLSRPPGGVVKLIFTFLARRSKISVSAIYLDGTQGRANIKERISRSDQRVEMPKSSQLYWAGASTRIREPGVYEKAWIRVGRPR